MSFNERLKIARKNAGKTQKETAEAIGMTPNAYQKYELGTSEPNLTKLVFLADMFNVSLDYLLCRDNFLQSHEVSFDEQ
ncbi:MAG: helix-turn-helix transcriptional regulator [Lachnospiraceae bacterium]|jgi:Predicted transcriptional regulators|nr:helix-turn-helix transcriptional regulator [Lachnospiraceae bacterium]